MFTPGADTSGNMLPSHEEGPRPLKLAMTSLISVAPTPNDSGFCPGLAALPTPGPKPPAAKSGKIPSAHHARTELVKVVLQLGPELHELFTTSG